AENTLTLNNNTATVNKMYVAYMGTEKPVETISLTQLMKNAVSFYQVDAPADKSTYTLEETGYYTVLLSYADGKQDTDVSYILYTKNIVSDGSLIPSVDNEADSSRVVINFNGLENVVKVCYGYIGTENYEYTTYKDFVAKATGRVTDSSVADGDIFKIAKVGYYRFIINYNNAEGKNIDVVYTVSNKADILPKVTLDGSVATLMQSVDAPVNKVYVGYMGKEDPGTISNWTEYSALKQSHYCVASPANGQTFLLKTQGYYTFVVNYALGSGSADAYYTIKIDQEAVSRTLPSVENSDNPCIAVFDSNGYTVNKICYGYLGTEYTEYAGYSDYVAKASNRMVDTVLTDGDTFLMTNVGYYRFIVNYNDGTKNYDAVYTLNNTVNISPVVTLEGSLATLKYNSGAPVNKVYVGYMGETDPGDISDWTTYSASRVSQNCVVSPIDGANIILKKAGYHTFVVNYTVGSKDKDVYYSFKTDEAAPSDLGIPKLDADGLKRIVISANGSNGINKVYYGSVGTTYTEYAGFEDFRKNSRDEILVSSVEDGDLFNLSKVNCYYRFIISYVNSNGKTTEVVYTAKVSTGGVVTIL
ncbi:MAG: hypothetical protein IKU15_04710, partial [Clostridia bacterium]|nr:hypothetical protein [Clostridia bacterium]